VQATFFIGWLAGRRFSSMQATWKNNWLAGQHFPLCKPFGKIIGSLGGISLCASHF